MDLSSPAWTFLSFAASVIGIILSTSLTILFPTANSQKALAFEDSRQTPMLIDTGSAIINGNSIEYQTLEFGRITHP